MGDVLLDEWFDETDGTVKKRKIKPDDIHPPIVELPAFNATPRDPYRGHIPRVVEREISVKTWHFEPRNVRHCGAIIGIGLVQTIIMFCVENPKPAAVQVMMMGLLFLIMCVRTTTVKKTIQTIEE